MPELPEVETIVRQTRPGLLGRRFLSFEARWPRQAQPSPEALRAGLIGRRAERLERRGKTMILRLDDGGALLLHLRMSGRFAWLEPGDPQEPPHLRMIFGLDDGRGLGFCDARKFGRATWTRDPEAALAGLGPEPLDPSFGPRQLAERLAGRQRALKACLLDQSLIAGLGNIYSDEALFRAQLHPALPASALRPRQLERLHAAIRAVLAEGIEQCGTSLDWVYPGGHMQDYLRVYGRRGEPCPVCGAAIERIVLAQRSTHFCPGCQAGSGRGPRRTQSST